MGALGSFTLRSPLVHRCSRARLTSRPHCAPSRLIAFARCKSPSACMRIACITEWATHLAMRSSCCYALWMRRPRSRCPRGCRRPLSARTGTARAPTRTPSKCAEPPCARGRLSRLTSCGRLRHARARRSSGGTTQGAALGGTGVAPAASPRACLVLGMARSAATARCLRARTLYSCATFACARAADAPTTPYGETRRFHRLVAPKFSVNLDNVTCPVHARSATSAFAKSDGGFLESTSRQGQACPWDN